MEKSHWKAQTNFIVTAIESNDYVSVGNALRLIDQRNVIRGDFVLVSSDTVSNMSLRQEFILSSMLLPDFRAVMVGPPNILVATPACIGACISKNILQSLSLEESLATLVLDEIFFYHMGMKRT